MKEESHKLEIEHEEYALRSVGKGASKTSNISVVSLEKKAEAESEAKYVAENVYEQTEKEHNMTLIEGLRLYNRAVIWSVIVSLTIVMDGYNITLLNSLFGFESFKVQYGELLDNGKYDLSASWQTALSMLNCIGNIIGIIMGGWAVDKIGHKRLMQISFFFAVAFTFILVFAPSKPILFVGQILMGLPNGIFGVIGTMYASEVCPVVLRGYLTTYINICFIVGQLISQCVLKGCNSSMSYWSYRIPFAVQWVWPVILFIPISMAPDSPWWLIRKERLADVRLAFGRLISTRSTVNVDIAIDTMVHTTNVEKEFQAGTSYLDCFKGVDLRRTEISAIGLMIQSVSLGNVMAFAVYFFQQAGIDSSASFSLGIGQYALGLVGTLISWVLLARNVGRRPLYLYGLFLIGLSFLIMGFISLPPSSNQIVKWVTAVLLYIAVFFYDMTIGPIAFALVGEISSSRLRAKTIGISRSLFQVWSIVNSIIYPYMLNSTAGNWKGKIGFFQAGMVAVAFLWAYFRLPEPAGRTYEELGIMFIKKVKARDFKAYKIDSLDITNT